MKEKAETMIQQVVKTTHLNYLFYLPEGAAAEPLKKWPLILFLHGAGERGNDLSLIRSYGIPRAVEETPEFPFITVSPQCPEHDWWPELLDELDALLVDVVARHPVNLERIYLTGLSMGGYGTWSWAVRHPERFAALAPVCGGMPEYTGFPQRACELKQVPIWVFHGAKDPIVPISESEKIVRELERCGGNVRFTVYPEAGHDSWTPTYANPELYRWFQAQKRNTVG